MKSLIKRRTSKAPHGSCRYCGCKTKVERKKDDRGRIKRYGVCHKRNCGRLTII